MQVQAATLELSWKQREADLMQRAERSRIEAGRSSASERLDLRRSDDDGRAIDVILDPDVATRQDW